jgi:Ca-activated chloride channel homolog
MQLSRTTFLVGTLALACSWSSAAAQSVMPEVLPEYPAIGAGSPTSLYVLVDFTVATAPETNKPRPPVNLALVIDRSGSMEDSGKLTFAQKAAKDIVDGLAPTDLLAIVEYDDHITVLRPSSPLTDPAVVKRLIDKLTPRGSTNLYGGVERGVAEVQKAVSRQAVSRVLLLSDGLANQGVTQPREIARRVAQARGHGVHLSAIGLGLEYNEDLMQTIAEAGGGKYYYVEHPTQLARVFAEEMSLILAAVAKDVEMSFEREALASKAEVFGYATQASGNTLSITQSDFHSAEKRLLVMRVDLPALSEGTHRLGTVRMTYNDVLTGKREVVSRELVVTATANAAEVASRRDKRVAAEVTLVEAEQRYAESVRQYERGDRQGAAASNQTLTRDLTAKNAQLNDKRIAKKLEALTLETAARQTADSSAENRQMYLKDRKMGTYASSKGTRTSYILQEGDSGIEVERLQRALAAKSAWSGANDGRFGPELTHAVREFQLREGIEADGVAGPMTLQKLGLY